MGHHKLFLVDDSIAVQKIVQLTFADEGFEVEVAGDGASALQKLAVSRPDVILMDVALPDTSGYEVCRQLRQNENFKRTPIVFLVGTFEPFDEKEARRSGADDVLTKPFQSIRNMVQKVGALLGGRSEEQPQEEERSSFATLGVNERRVSKAETFAAEDAAASGVSASPPPPKTEAEANVIIEVKPRTEFDDNKVHYSVAPAEAVASSAEMRFEDLEPVMPFAPEENSKPPVKTAAQVSLATQGTDDSLLDLGEDDAVAATPMISETDDVILDLDDEPSVVAPAAWPSQRVQPAAAVIAAPPLVATAQEARGITIDQLSPELIDAIARRVVEHLSTKVLEDVAWEVVPPLAELLIKQQLENKNSPPKR